MKAFRLYSCLFFAMLMLAGCSSMGDTSNSGTQRSERDFPIDSEDERRLRRSGRMTGDGLILFGGDGSEDKGIFGGGGEDASGGGGPSMAINPFLWRATLDSLSFMPLASTDPVGGVVLTDWYEDPEQPGERFKINALLEGRELRPDAIRISIFRQALDPVSHQWRDVPSSESVARNFEDIILTRARELVLVSKN